MSLYHSVFLIPGGGDHNPKKPIPVNEKRISHDSSSDGFVNKKPNDDSNSINSAAALALSSFVLAPIRCMARQPGTFSQTLKSRLGTSFFGVDQDYRKSAVPLGLMVFLEQAVARKTQEKLKEAGYSNTLATIGGTLSGAVVGGGICPFTVSNRSVELTVRRYSLEALGSTIRNSGSIAGFLANPFNSQDDPGKRSLFTGVVFAGTRAFDASWQQMLDGGKPCRGRIIKCMGMSGIYATGVTSLSDKILNSKIFQR